MLYVTTRNNRDAYTAQRALRENRGPDGGLYVPFREPKFAPEQIDALAEKSFNQCVAELLNLLFNTRLTGWDVDFCAGRHSVRLVNMTHRLVVAECWHNVDSEFPRLVRNLTDQIRADRETDTKSGDWAEVGVRIAVLFGICGELMREGIAGREKPYDISVTAGDFSGPISAWYARRWGLPIGNIVCCCNDNSNLWDFICHGQLRTDGVAVKTTTPEGDRVVPSGLERLIYAYGGPAETERYVEVCRRGGTYYVSDALLRELRKGIYVTVTSTPRVSSTIPSVYRTHSYLLAPGSALAYAGLQDYRSRTGESRCAVLLSEQSPDRDAGTVAAALGISAEELKRYL